MVRHLVVALGALVVHADPVPRKPFHKHVSDSQNVHAAAVTERLSEQTGSYALAHSVGVTPHENHLPTM